MTELRKQEKDLVQKEDDYQKALEEVKQLKAKLVSQNNTLKAKEDMIDSFADSGKDLVSREKLLKQKEEELRSKDKELKVRLKMKSDKIEVKLSDTKKVEDELNAQMEQITKKEE